MRMRFLKLYLLLLLVSVAPLVSSEVGRTSSDVLIQLEAAVGLSTNNQEKAVLRGLIWLDEFVRDDEHLHFIFSDYLLMLNELALRRPGPVSAGARQMIHDAFQRSAENLKEIFEQDEAGKWDYISILALLEIWQIPGKPFVDFYNSHFPSNLKMDYDDEFEKALKKLDYDTLGDILIDTSFAHFFRKKISASAFNVPETGFSDYLKRVTGLPYGCTFDKDENAYSDQNYYVTHVIFVATDYGQQPMPDGALSREMRQYLESEFACVRYQVREIDLIAEFVHCLKLFGQKERPDVREAVDYLLSLQHEDGSWGTEEDFEGDAYDIFHPTWAVITALNY
jgi:hypothetical protein